MDGPDLPAFDEPVTADVFMSRWPTAAHKSELISGVLYFTGTFDERDVVIAERTSPGRRVLLRRCPMW
ncbi:hypothetical protein ACWGNN_47170 [Streptomyces sp. NPDC055817]